MAKIIITIKRIISHKNKCGKVSPINRIDAGRIIGSMDVMCGQAILKRI